MKNLMACLFAFILLFALTASAQKRGADLVKAAPERRVALVIGNGAYESAPLPNPVKDAKDMAEALEGFGFEVTHRDNLNRDEMEYVIQSFGKQLRTSDVALFYYAGHGLQVSQVNYLVPIDAKIEREGDVKRECIPAEFVLEQMEGLRDRINIMILDACRNNPFTRGLRSVERGLSPMDAPVGTLIAYATKSGSVTPDDSLYTRELLRFMRVPGLEVQDVFKKVRASVWELTKDQERSQMPWVETSLVGEFYFVEPRPSPSPTPAVSPDELLEIIKSEQRSKVRESSGVNNGQNFSDDMLKEFKGQDVPQSVTERLKHNSYFIDIVLAIKQMRPGTREKLLNEGMRTYKKTWVELGRISPEGQTDAGQEAERLIAQAIIDLVMELSKLPTEKIDALRK
jgi:Caspase domain